MNQQDINSLLCNAISSCVPYEHLLLQLCFLNIPTLTTLLLQYSYSYNFASSIFLLLQLCFFNIPTPTTLPLQYSYSNNFASSIFLLQQLCFLNIPTPATLLLQYSYSYNCLQLIYLQQLSSTELSPTTFFN